MQALTRQSRWQRLLNRLKKDNLEIEDAEPSSKKEKMFSPFLRLPYELRELVYDELTQNLVYHCSSVIANTDGGLRLSICPKGAGCRCMYNICWQATGQPETHYTVPWVSIIRTCRKIYHELAPLLIITRSILHVHDVWAPGKLRRKIPRRHLAKMTQIALVLSFGDDGHIPGTETFHYLRTAGALHPSQQSLTEVHWWYWSEMWKSFSWSFPDMPIIDVILYGVNHWSVGKAHAQLGDGEWAVPIIAAAERMPNLRGTEIVLQGQRGAFETRIAVVKLTGD